MHRFDAYSSTSYSRGVLLCFFGTLKEERNPPYLQLRGKLNDKMMVLGFVYDKSTPNNPAKKCSFCSFTNTKQSLQYTIKTHLNGTPRSKFEENVNYILVSPPRSMKQCNKRDTVKFYVELLLEAISLWCDTINLADCLKTFKSVGSENKNRVTAM